MSGTAVGTLNMRIDSGGWETNGQEMFVSVYNGYEYFAAQGKCTRLASYYGDGGTGMDYHDGANPAGEHAWALYLWPSSATRDYDFYTLLQWGKDACTTTGNGSPCSLGPATASGAWLGMQAAVGVNILGSGSAQTVSLVSGDTWALTDSAGLFTGAMVGKKVRIKNADASRNNGRFIVTAVPSTTSLQFTNAKGSAESNVGILWEVAEAKNSNPWNGTLLNNGADAKGNPVWKNSLTSRAHIYPRSNAPGGSFEADKSNLCACFYPTYGGNAATRAHLIADDDNVVMLRDESDLATILQHAFVGSVDELDGLEGDHSLCMFAGSTSQGQGSTYGPPGGSLTLEGGSYVPSEQTVQSLSLDTFDLITDYRFSPNLSYSSTTYNEYPLDIHSSKGHLGELDSSFIRQVYNLVSLDTLNSKSRLVTGHTTVHYSNCLYYTFPWDGITDPRDAGATRVGVTF